MRWRCRSRKLSPVEAVFVGTAIVAVWYVFRDPRFDYRLLVVDNKLIAATQTDLRAAVSAGRTAFAPLATSSNILPHPLCSSASRWAK